MVARHLAPLLDAGTIVQLTGRVPARGTSPYTAPVQVEVGGSPANRAHVWQALAGAGLVLVAPAVRVSEFPRRRTAPSCDPALVLLPPTLLGTPSGRGRARVPLPEARPPPRPSGGHGSSCPNASDGPEDL